MSLPTAKVQMSLFDVSMLLESLFPETDRYRIFYKTVLPALWARRKQLCDLYCQDNGRPAIEPVILMAVTLLQFMEKLPDRQAAENVRLHLGWKYAMGLEIDYAGFHFSNLSNFRNRMIQADDLRICFDAVLDALHKSGLIRKRGRQRLDSTHVIGTVATISRLECIRETIRLFLEHVRRNGQTDALPGWSTYFERYCDSQIQWHRLKKAALQDKALEAGNDAMALIAWMETQPELIFSHERAHLLKRVFAEQYETAGAAVEQRMKQAPRTVKNPHDPDAQWATKGQKPWVGYKVQIAETVSEDGPREKKGDPTEQFITEITTTEATASDLEGMHKNLNDQQHYHADRPQELYVDAAYITDDTLAEAEQQGRDIYGPARCPGNPKHVFDVDMFDINTNTRTAICPAGHTSSQCSLIHDAYNNTVVFRFEWGRLCDECQMRKQCTRRKDGRRHVSVGIHHNLLQKRRREMKTDEFKQIMYRRNGVEGTISEFARAGGRRTRYRGLRKTTLANFFHGAALNTNRWVRLQQHKIKKPDMAE